MLPLRRIDCKSGAVTTVNSYTNSNSSSDPIRFTPYSAVIEPRTGLLFFIENDIMYTMTPNGARTDLYKFRSPINNSLTVDEVNSCNLNSLTVFDRWPPGLLDVIALFLPRVSLLVVEADQFTRVALSF